MNTKKLVLATLCLLFILWGESGCRRMRRHIEDRAIDKASDMFEKTVDPKEPTKEPEKKDEDQRE